MCSRMYLNVRGKEVRSHFSYPEVGHTLVEGELIHHSTVGLRCDRNCALEGQTDLDKSHSEGFL